MAKWERRGECNHCGWCCVFVIQKIRTGVIVESPKHEEFLVARGFKPTVKNGEQMFTDGKPVYEMVGEFFAPCPQHVAGKCRIYDIRPEVCREFPQNPDQVVNTPCSYWFEDAEGKEVPVGGDASPYSRRTEDFRRIVQQHESGAGDNAE